MLALLLLLPCLWMTPTDVVELTSGKQLTGRVVYADDEVVVLRVKSRDKEIPRSEIASVISTIDRLDALLDRLAEPEGRTIDALLAAARECEQGGQTGEARLLRLRVALLDPENEEAHTALGHKLRRRKGWTFKRGNKWLPVTQLGTPADDWSDRWELSTTHFELHTNLGLSAAIDAAFDLERIHRAFYGMFARELRLFDIVETMRVQLHADTKSYPEPGGNRPGYFTGGDQTLFVLAEHGLPYKTLVHEATHAMLFMTTRRTKGAKGNIPGWLDEGLAEYFEISQRRLGGALGFALGRLSPGHFRAHVNGEKRYKLSRVLTFDGSDFFASSRTAQKYGQSYTLVHFMLHGDGERHRQAFFDFVRGAYSGKSSMTHFEKVLSMPEDDFETAWNAYADEVAARS